MSQWTHVAGVFRYDCKHMVERKDLMKELRYLEDLFHDAPAGSEGGLEFDILPMFDYSNKEHVTLMSTHLANVVISGDLRDFSKDNWTDIEAWFAKVTDDEDVEIRQAVLLMDDDDYPIPEHKVLIYEAKIRHEKLGTMLCLCGYEAPSGLGLLEHVKEANK